MSAFFTLNFDLAVYYTILMYLADVIIMIPRFAPGYVFLVLMISLYSLRITYLQERTGLNVLCAFVPFLSLLFRPTLLQAGLMAPVWIWLVIRMYRMDYDHGYSQFKNLCGNVLITEFILSLVLFYLTRTGSALISTIPYLAIELCVMVCTLRYLRQERTGGMISLAMTGSVMVLSLLASLTGFLSRVFRLLGRIYLTLVSKLFSSTLPDQLPQIDTDIELPDALIVDTGGTPMESTGNVVINVIAAVKEMSLLEKILIIAVLVLIVLAVAGVILYSLKGHRYYRRKKNEDITEKIEGKKKSRMPLFAPADHREAVRWYYARYMKECRKKGILITPQMNSAEIEAADDLLDSSDKRAFRDLYIRCRYSSYEADSEDVKKAKQFYKNARNAARA
ncbi:MAG: hypothetical protein IJ252_05550 [Solobacterium sp.]|nr:hypothetical protein [Solobacterium sp.]